MANKMLIDSTHAEETRVVVVKGNRVEEFDFESANKRPLRGNIYLAKVTRVEPSLQAAFVDYGGNRHGFLPFAEIHPDYYQIPVADRQALIAEEARAAAERENSEDGGGRSRRGRRGRRHDTRHSKTVAAEQEGSEKLESAPLENEEATGEEQFTEIIESAPIENESVESNESAEGEAASTDGAESAEVVETAEPTETVEAVGGADAMEEVPERSHRVAPRRYKIQEVIKRRQVILVQVVKEERGTKGAALTTYLSLAGRYSVLMPNTARGGGVSRKIANAEDRKRLKEVAQELDIPEGMGIIVRTAGAARTKAEIKRDFEYLMRLWETVADLTMKSQAPALVYEEGSLVKRAIRDLYNKDIDEIVVAGDTAYQDARDFMRMLMPSHAKNIIDYKETVPIFTKYGVESQLDGTFQPQVQLRSGGYIVINQTEALVAIDVNSGRATREHNIEDTALRTNLEAAEEISRQLRLRDLAGLIVIDFIDMEEHRNNRAVERRLKECLKHDRARIQVGRISHFGLLEMSRQRLRASMFESTTEVCSVCNGAGHVRSPASSALQILRMLEERLMQDASHNLMLRARTRVALYVLNQKRTHLHDLERRFGVTILVEAEDKLPAGASFLIERAAPSGGQRTEARAVTADEKFEESSVGEEEPREERAPHSQGGRDEADGERHGGRRRRRRGRGRRGRGGGNFSPRFDNQEEGSADISARREQDDRSGEREPRQEERDDEQQRIPRRKQRAQQQEREEHSSPADPEMNAAAEPRRAKDEDDATPAMPRIPDLPELSQSPTDEDSGGSQRRGGWWSRKSAGR